MTGVAPGDYLIGDKIDHGGTTKFLMATGAGSRDVIVTRADLDQHKLRHPHTKADRVHLYRTIEALFPTTTVAHHAVLLGAIVGCDDAA